MGTVKKSGKLTEREIGIRNVKAVLYLLRHGSVEYGWHFGTFWGEMRKYKLTLKDVGTSQKELQELRDLGIDLFIKWRLSSLRSGSNLVSVFLPQIDHARKECGKSLKSMGVDKEELKILTMKHLNQEIGCLHSDLSVRNILIEIDYCRRSLRSLGVPFTAQELAKMQSEINRICK